MKEIVFEEKKVNHFYSQRNEKGNLVLVQEPAKGEKYFEFSCISGGTLEEPKIEAKPLILEIPIPLCDKHRKEHDDKPFFVKTCNEWIYLAIPVQLGSLQCRECKKCLFLPMPFLYSANLRSADLRSANLRSANLRSANLYSANLRSANLRSANLRSANLRSANLRSADLRLANLSSANLRSANLYSANLSSADLSSADLSSARNLKEAYNLDKAYWNKFTKIDDEFKKLLSKHRF